MLSALDLLRRLGWAVIDFIYNLIDTLTLIDYIDTNYVIEKKKPIKEIADEEININYKVIIFVGLSMIGFKALVIPKKKKRR